MATESKIPGAVTKIERTFHVDRLTPVSGDYAVRVHRETLFAIDGQIQARTEEAFVDPVSILAKRACTRDYLAACQRAKVPLDLLAAEAAWYDALVDEIRAEREKAAVDGAAQEAVQP